MAASRSALVPGAIVRGPLLPEPIELITAVAVATSVRLIGRGLRSSRAYDPVLTLEQLSQLEVAAPWGKFDGDARLFRLGVEAHRLGLAFEYDPYFSLSIARVDPLPHQLEAVYDYFMRLPRIRFLLADDPGAGKTIMAGLLLKEMKARGLVQRTLIVTPANLGFQWQRELRDKFREPFKIIRSAELRSNYGVNPWQDIDQAITSVSWVSRIDDARESLFRSRWDLVIVDEAHKMSAYAEDRKTLAYRLGEALSSMTDHYLLMTANGSAPGMCPGKRPAARSTMTGSSAQAPTPACSWCDADRVNSWERPHSASAQRANLVSSRKAADRPAERSRTSCAGPASCRRKSG
ncbi:MAG: DEAD/DEAH box helicase [Planctomycetes bacterium]|nr:DEAD/DEAH box helicase [Planctomycetota bacterium]